MVKIHFEDLIFGIENFGGYGKNGFFNFAGESSLGG